MTTYYLYHHHPDPLPPEDVGDPHWLINNTVAYSVVAVIDAPDVSLALQAAFCKVRAQTLPRKTAVRAGNLLRETLPGDVLVTTDDAWMVDADAASPLRKVSSEKSPTWRSFGQRSTVDGLAWSPDGRLLAVAENDTRVVLRTFASKGDEDYPTAYARGQYAAEHLAWSPDGTRLASAGFYGEVHLWQPALWRSGGSHSGYTGSILICGTEERTSSYEHIRCLAWTPDGKRIVVGREDGCVLSWNAQTGQDVRLQKRHAKAILALAFSPREHQLLLTASSDTTIQIWDEVSAQERVQYNHAREVMAAVWSPDGSLVASCEKQDPTVHLWRSQTGDLQERLPLSIYTTRDLTIRSLAWSPDGTFLAAGCDDRTIQFIDPALHQHVQTFWTTRASERQTVYALAWSPDSTLLASGGSAASVDIWQVRPSQTPEEAVTPPAFAEEGV